MTLLGDKMNYLSLSKTFNTAGFVIIPDVLPRKHMITLRKSYKKSLRKHQLQTLTPSQFLQEIDIAQTIFQPVVVDTIRHLTHSHYCMYPDFTIRENLYIPWHTDAAHLPFDVANDGASADFIQCSIYLQNNTHLTGGGLRVIPGSHLWTHVDRANPNKTDQLSGNDGELMHSKAGDLVLWDSRIIHKSVENKNPKVPKLAIQWTISSQEKNALSYINYLQQRKEKTAAHVSDTGERENAFINDIEHISYPTSFPSALRSSIQQQQIPLIMPHHKGVL
jgi:ectoine hydroxylase-related dioxygenase (phytanoyl-CoA dioxygenase family)